jgi:hypothetical protein
LQVSEKGASPRQLEVDHVIAGTGYEVDVDRLPFLDADLRARVRRVSRAPALTRNFESSVAGLYFIGPASALSFGPLFRFVAGAAYASPTVAKHVVATRRRRHFPWSSAGESSPGAQARASGGGRGWAPPARGPLGGQGRDG